MSYWGSSSLQCRIDLDKKTRSERRCGGWICGVWKVCHLANVFEIEPLLIPNHVFPSPHFPPTLSPFLSTQAILMLARTTTGCGVIFTPALGVRECKYMPSLWRYSAQRRRCLPHLRYEVFSFFPCSIPCWLWIYVMFSAIPLTLRRAHPLVNLDMFFFLFFFWCSLLTQTCVGSECRNSAISATLHQPAMVPTVATGGASMARPTMETQWHHWRALALQPAGGAVVTEGRVCEEKGDSDDEGQWWQCGAAVTMWGGGDDVGRRWWCGVTAAMRMTMMISNCPCINY